MTDPQENDLASGLPKTPSLDEDDIPSSTDLKSKLEPLDVEAVPQSVLGASTSFDSETDSDFHNRTTDPLQSSFKQNPSHQRGYSDALSSKVTFEVTDDSDFEILDDDEEDDAGNDGDDERIEEEEEKDLASEEDEAELIQSAKSTYDSPPISPTRGTPRSPMSPASPLSPQRRFMNRFPMVASMSPKKAERGMKEESDSADIKEEKPKRSFLAQAADIKSPLPTFKAIRARAIAAYGKDTTKEPSIQGTDVPDWEQEADLDGSSSGDSSYDDDMLSIGDDSLIFEDDDMDQVIDFSTLSNLPNSFLNLPPDVYDYLDPDLVKNIGEQDISAFAWEHHLLVKGLMQLLAERDHIGVEGDVHDTFNVLKMGPLKKMYAKLWFVKYVEIRKGNLTYYDDSMKDGSTNRTTIHLRKRTCTCQAVTTKDGSSAGYVFELIVEGGHKRLWMAKSEEEREGWIRAINQGMIGETDDSQDAPLDLTLYQTAIEVFQSVQSSLLEVKTRQDYLVAVDTLLYRHRSSSALRVPMKWIREQVVEEEEEKKEPNAPHKRVRSTISDFWKTLSTTPVVINGFSVEANSVYSAERVIGALSRCILEFDKVDRDQEMEGMLSSVKRSPDSFITEVETASYARSILTGVLRSKSRDDVLAAVEKLVRKDVACVKLESSEPLHIDVSFAGDDFSEYVPPPNDVTGWLPTRPKKSKAWKQRYFVVSEGVLSFFEKAHPRPYGLRGQLVLADAKVTILDENMLMLQTKDNERHLRFDNRGDFVKWKTIIERATDPEGTLESALAQESAAPRRRTRTIGTVKPIWAGKRAMKAMKGAKDAGMKSIKNARGIIARGIRGGTPNNGEGSRRRPEPDMLLASTRTIQSKTQKREPTVQVVVELNSICKVMPNAKSGDQEALLIVRVKLFQAFLLSGGANGRIARGDELLEMEFIEGDGLEEIDHEFLEPPTVL